MKKIQYCDKDYIGHSIIGNVIFKGVFEAKEVAVKRMVFDDEILVDIDILLECSFQHKNIIRYFHKEADEEFIYLAMELGYGAIAKYFTAKFQTIRESNSIIDLKDILEQTSMGLDYLHTKNIVHGNLKPENILFVQHRDNFVVKITDYGIIENPVEIKPYISYNPNNPLAYRAPEVFENYLERTKKSDVFSLGCVFHFMLSNGKVPFSTKIIGDSCLQFIRVPLTVDDKNDKHSAERLISNMIENEAASRFTVKEVLEDYFLNYKTRSKSKQSDLKRPITMNIEWKSKFSKLSTCLKRSNEQEIASQWPEIKLF